LQVYFGNKASLEVEALSSSKTGIEKLEKSLHVKVSLRADAGAELN
jgi:hypothetical protein